MHCTAMHFYIELQCMSRGPANILSENPREPGTVRRIRRQAGEELYLAVSLTGRFFAPTYQTLILKRRDLQKTCPLLETVH